MNDLLPIAPSHSAKALKLMANIKQDQHKLEEIFAQYTISQRQEFERVVNTLFKD